MGTISGIETLRLWVEALGEMASLPASVQLVLDVPWGYAVSKLPILPRPVLVITENHSPEYLRDLQDLNPEGLIAIPLSLEEVGRAAVRVARGERFYVGPPLETDAISPREREVLRSVALGLGNREIAKRLGVHERTVANWVSSLRDKLGVRNRVELALYYLGVPGLRDI